MNIGFWAAGYSLVFTCIRLPWPAPYSASSKQDIAVGKSGKFYYKTYEALALVLSHQ